MKGEGFLFHRFRKWEIKMDGISVICEKGCHRSSGRHSRIIRWFYFIIILILYYKYTINIINIDNNENTAIGFFGG